MRLLKKTVAFILIAFLSFVPIAGVAVTVPITVYAASPALSSTSLTVKVGQTKTLKIKNASAKKWGQTADIVKLAEHKPLCLISADDFPNSLKFPGVGLTGQRIFKQHHLVL